MIRALLLMLLSLAIAGQGMATPGLPQILKNAAPALVVKASKGESCHSMMNRAPAQKKPPCCNKACPDMPACSVLQLAVLPTQLVHFDFAPSAAVVSDADRLSSKPPPLLYRPPIQLLA